MRWKRGGCNEAGDELHLGPSGAIGLAPKSDITKPGFVRELSTARISPFQRKRLMTQALERDRLWYQGVAADVWGQICRHTTRWD